MSAAETNWPALTVAPDNVRLPAPGRVVIFTALKVFGGALPVSRKPKSAVPNVYVASSNIAMALSVPAGATLSGTDA